MNAEPDNTTHDPYEAFNRLTPHSATLGFDLQVALNNYLSALEQIGPTLTADQVQPLHHDLVQHSLRAVFNAFNALEQDIVKIRHGITDDDAN